MNRLLEGIRVLDFGRYIAGPYCATLLGFLGADVIRVEKREGGEDRYLHPLSRDTSGKPQEGALFFQTGCNKRSITLNPGSEKGREVLRKLASTADIVVANLPNAELLRLGLDYESLKLIKSDVILISQSTFGSTGPDADRPGFDGVGQAMSGAMYFSGLEHSPAKAAATYVDYATAVLSAFGALAALIELRKSGRGQHVESALLRTALSIFGPFLTEQATLGLDRLPSGNTVQTSGPSDCFEVLDGHVLVHTIGNKAFRRLAILVGRPEWQSSPMLQTDEDRGQCRIELRNGVAEWCAKRTRSEALEALQQAGIAAGPVMTIREAIENPLIHSSGWSKPVAFPGLSATPVVMDLPIKFSEIESGIHSRPPLLGEHTDSILLELGYTLAEIGEMKRASVI